MSSVIVPLSLAPCLRWGLFFFFGPVVSAVPSSVLLVSSRPLLHGVIALGPIAHVSLVSCGDAIAVCPCSCSRLCLSVGACGLKAQTFTTSYPMLTIHHGAVSSKTE